jgi:hypothetical protein
MIPANGGWVGELAQLGERLVCNQEVTGSSPVFSTKVLTVWREPDGLFDN